MKKTNKIKNIIKALKKDYPEVKTQLIHKNPFQLLIATMLSAQCTDKQVNKATPALFARFSTPADFKDAPLKEIEKLIHSTGFYKIKAKRLKDCGAALVKHYNGVVPKDMNALTALPGVGRKTANVVMNAAFEIPGVVVDTHVSRISRHLGLVKSKDTTKIEYELMEVLPEDVWIDFSLWMIYHGRAVCKARKPDCGICSLKTWCDFGKKQ